MNIDDTILVIGGPGPYKGIIDKVARIEGDKYVIVEDGQPFGFYADVNSVEYVNPEYMSEMATVARIPATNKRSALRIEVNPDRKRKGDPYFKVMDTTRNTKIIRHMYPVHKKSLIRGRKKKLNNIKKGEGNSLSSLFTSVSYFFE